MGKKVNEQKNATGYMKQWIVGMKIFLGVIVLTCCWPSYYLFECCPFFRRDDKFSASLYQESFAIFIQPSTGYDLFRFSPPTIGVLHTRGPTGKSPKC